RVEEFFINAAAQVPDRSFLLGGSGWHDKSMPANVRSIGHVRTGEHNAFFCSGRATLNINRESMARYGFSPPTRVFEAAGAGACLVTDAWVGLELFLEPGREVLVARDGAEVAEHVRALDERRAREIGDAARRRGLAEHTYAHRALRQRACPAAALRARGARRRRRHRGLLRARGSGGRGLGDTHGPGRHRVLRHRHPGDAGPPGPG